MNIPAGLAQRFAQMAQNVASQAARGSMPGADAAGGAGLGTPGSLPGAQPGGPTFGDSLKQAISQVSDTQNDATEQVNAFLRGEQVELHQVMAATEEAGIALEMLIEIRNKFTEAYRTVINMQS